MDLFIFRKAEKDGSPIPRCSLLQIAAKLLRFIQLCLLLLSLSWLLSRLPIAAEFLATPLFGFLLCNAIILALLAKPSQLPALTDHSDQIYQNLIHTTASRDVAVQAQTADPDRREKLRRSPEIDLSGEEFQRMIEEFIAREKRFRREECSAIVVLGSSFVQR